MCCFSLASPGRLARWLGTASLAVSGTRIFARHLSVEWQGLVYELTLSTPSDVAMILPLPVRPGSGEGGVEFIDLSAYADFFSDLDRGFPAPVMGLPRSRGVLPQPKRAPLIVHRVGAFDASFVPTVHDFDRLDPRFRLPQGTWDKLPHVEDYGFAVFTLGKGRRQAVHPMALRFRRRDDARLFFPTVHIHDGQVHPRADFDHTLYAQGRPADSDWRQSYGAASIFADVERAKGLVDGSARVWARDIRGDHDNTDIRL